MPTISTRSSAPEILKSTMAIFCYLHPRANPVPGAPVSKVSKWSAKTFSYQLFTHRFYAAQKQYSKTVEMINTQTPPPGVGFGSNTGAVSSDSTAYSVVVSITADSTQTDTSLALAVAAGTSFFDEAGNPITGNSLNVNVAYFSGSTSASLAAFPGGLGPNQCDPSRRECFGRSV